MLELMLAGNNKPIVPESGPGNKQLLAGNRTDGWFGIIPAAEMPSPFTIATTSGLSVTLPQINNNPLTWLKAVLDGKYIFFSSTPFNNTTLTALYNAGVVYGTDDNGLRTPTGSSPTNQLKLIVFKDSANKTWCFKIRLINTINPNTMTSTDTPASTSVYAGEMYKLFSHIMASGNVPQDGVKWDKFVAGREFYNDRYHSNSVQAGSVFQGAPTYTLGQYGWYGVGVSVSWMPVLELINPDVELVPPIEVTGAAPKMMPANVNATSNIDALSSSELTMISSTLTPPLESAPASPEPLSAGAVNTVNAQWLPPHMTN
ncbi:hypothetical protein pEaSNUABM37_00106 [Erwinia phage pEa_SNUABM_37]|nr:hypothetical protein pEaSNUABM37_00106 [Erwinia phage pEa_SNUABM_37]QXO10576.1 hypothetical protein pEaSNUABM48_00106 [Erwinia phage pEa_SNUABM_48]